ncbi:MAG: hypothetical protein ACRCZF_18000, partial [Gemmataceae bacterium]
MVRFWSRALTALVAAGGILASGCTTTQKSVQNTVSEWVAPAKPMMATECACSWSNRLAHLPDPSRNGQMTTGLVGQVFVFDSKTQPVDIHGDMTVTVHDSTIRPPGMPAMRSEVWHFTKDTLKNMVAMDERFGRSLVMFLPWPEAWRDVNRVYVQARYDQAGVNPLFAQPANVTLDLTAPAGNGNPNTMIAGVQNIP